MTHLRGLSGRGPTPAFHRPGSSTALEGEGASDPREQEPRTPLPSRPRLGPGSAGERRGCAGVGVRELPALGAEASCFLSDDEQNLNAAAAVTWTNGVGRARREAGGAAWRPLRMPASPPAPRGAAGAAGVRCCLPRGACALRPLQLRPGDLSRQMCRRCCKARPGAGGGNVPNFACFDCERWLPGGLRALPRL